MTELKNQAASCRFFFRKENRIQRRADFLMVYSKAKPIRRSLLHVFVYHHADTTTCPTRLGITATRKAGNSVRRNRARRLVREAFRHLLPELKPGYSIVVNTLRAATLSNYDQVHAQLKSILIQARVLPNTSLNATTENPE